MTFLSLLAGLLLAPGNDWLLDPAPFRAEIVRTADGRGLVLANGTVRREFRLEPNGATVALDELVHGRAVLRAVEPEARVTLDGVAYDVGGLVGQRDRAFLRPADVEALVADPAAFRLVGTETGTPAAPFEWKRVRHHDEQAAWPPHGVALRMDYDPPAGAAGLAGVQVRVHYELYDGLPCFAKWIEVVNGSARPITVDAFTSELLAGVERESRVETRPDVVYPHPNLWVETDFACGGEAESAQRDAVHWELDPDYGTQVSYLLQTPCRLECRPSRGPAQALAPGATFTSFRSFVLVLDGEDQARNGLARCRMYRTIAPWVTENPLMMHVRYADDESVRRAIDQCAAVGFELVIMTFGSGFDVEDESPANLARMKALAAYARERGIELGGYSLLSSRHVGGGNDVVSPEGESPTHGSCPALTSPWGLDYYRKLRAFFPATGFAMLEHDGPYPGDADVTARPPLQRGLDDSRWAQFAIAAGFYRWCRAQGIYLNTPDWYFLNGSTKSAMGYRETNWSLPRADQVLHTRQNLFDGTWAKTPTMGWMFVPLTEYQGGGEAATVEPLHEHLDHYRRLLEANLGAGAQACWRGPRLYDTDETRALVAAQVAWFKAHRRILEADIDHASSRRADGRDLDWLLHVDPRGEERGLLAVYNPLEHDVERTLDIGLYYTGLRRALRAGALDGSVQELALDRDYRSRIHVRIPAGGMNAYVLTGD